MSKEGSNPQPVDNFELEQRTERKSKLVAIREQLLANTSLFYAGEIVDYKNGSWTQTVGIIVAPTKPIFDIERLNEFMHSLVDIKPNSVDDAHPEEQDGIHLGKLYFDEPIGKKTTSKVTFITAIEPETLIAAGISIGETRETQEDDLKRRTWLRVYPDALSAQAVFDYEQGIANGTVEYNSTFEYLHHWVKGDQIRMMKENQAYNPFARVAGMLKGRR